MMHGHEKSRYVIVAVKPMNKAERSAAESVERRAETKGNVDQQSTRRTQRRISVSQMLARIRQHIVAVDTRGGNRMRESCTYGSARGCPGVTHCRGVGSGPEPVPVDVAVVDDELDVRSALGHATGEREVTAYGPQPPRRWHVVIAAINYCFIVKSCG